MNKPSIKYGDPLPFNDVGPICSFTYIDMQIDLFRGACHQSIEQSCEQLENVDCLMETRIPSPHGHYDISVIFGYFVHATVANLEVVLSPIPADATTTDVYGVVAATNSRFDYTYCTSALFSKESANSIKVGHNGVIPLSKPRVGLPLGSQLIVDICLFCDDEPYKGTAYFTPGRENESSVDIIDGRISVKVTWNCNEDPDETTDDDFDYTSESEYDSSDSESKDWEEHTENETLETKPCKHLTAG